MKDNLNPVGCYFVEHFRKLKKIGEYEINNLVVNTAKALILNSMFNGASTLPNWYVGVINNTPTPTIAATDTMVSHPLWVEYTAITNGSNVSLRPTWTRTTATSNIIASSSPSVVNFTASGTVYGLFITSDSTVGGSSGTLFSAAAFVAPITVLNGDQMRLTYSLQI